jgi:hypothetical protein
MEYLFERAFFSRVLEDYGADCLPIQVAAARKNAEPEFGKQLLFDLLKIDKLPGDLIGVKKLGRGQQLAQARAKSALACRNSTGNSDRWHLKPS